VCAAHVTINILPDEVLLHIFRFYAMWSQSLWYRLVHVCHRWRSLAFASPNFLELRLVCDSPRRRKHLGIWPPFPIIIIFRPNPGFYHYTFNVAIVRYERNRVCGIDLHLIRSELQELFRVTQEPFPALIHLNLQYHELDEYEGGTTPAIPEGFLGGSAPRLQSLELLSIPFPTLPKHLLSTTDLVDLRLWLIPTDGNISPKELVTSLAALPKLKTFIMEFEDPHFLPDRRHPTPTVLPALTHFQFKGKSEYLEVLVAGIDAPLLDTICITFSHELTFDIPEFSRFMRRTTKFQALDEAHIEFGYYDALVKSLPLTQTFDRFDPIENSGLIITCRETNWSRLGLAHAFTSLFPSIYIVEHLYVYGSRLSLSQGDKGKATSSTCNGWRFSAHSPL
jgi:hypothetical protein